MRLLLACVVAAVLTCPTAARADELEPVGLKEVASVVSSADGGTVAYGAFQGSKFVALLAGNPPRQMATADAYAQSEFGLTPDGRYLLVDRRRFDLVTGAVADVAIPEKTSFQTILANDGSLYTAQTHRLWRTAPDGSGGPVPQGPASLPGPSGWAAGGETGLGATGFGWCGTLHHRLSLGLLDTSRGAVTVRGTGLRPSPDANCTTALHGGAVATLAGRHTIAVLAAGQPVRRLRLRHDSFVFLSLDGRYALAGDLTRTPRFCLEDHHFGGVYVLDLLTGHKRFVHLPRGCATDPVWSAGDTRFATQIGSDVWIVDPATGGTVKVPGVGGALAFTPDGTRVVVGGRQWSTVSVDGGPLTPVTGAGWAPDPYAPRLEPFQRDIWFAGSRVYAVGRGGALFTAAAL
jgi:hypothetical protein